MEWFIISYSLLSAYMCSKGPWTPSQITALHKTLVSNLYNSSITNFIIIWPLNHFLTIHVFNNNITTNIFYIKVCQFWIWNPDCHDSFICHLCYWKLPFLCQKWASNSQPLSFSGLRTRRRLYLACEGVLVDLKGTRTAELWWLIKSGLSSQPGRNNIHV